MTVTTTTRLSIHQGNGVTTVFPYDFIIPSTDNLTVQLQDHTSGTINEILTPSAYIVTGIGDPNGGNVAYNPVGGPITSDVDIVIIRTMPYTQDLEINDQGGFFPETLTGQLDDIVMQIQQLAEEQSRSLIVNPGQEPPNLQDIADAVTAAEDSAADAAASAAAADISEAAAAASAASVVNVVAYLNTSEYTFATGTTYPPASGEVRVNNATQSSATFVYLSHTNLRGVDLTNMIPISIGIGSLLLIQDRTNVAKFQLYKVTGVPVLSGADFQVPVVSQTAGTALTAGPAMVGFGGGGGAASVFVGDNPPALPRTNGQLWLKASTGVFYIWYVDVDSAQWIQISAAPQVAALNTRNRGFIDPGFNLANDTTDATNDILFPTGVVASDVAPYPLMSHDATIRQLDVTFDTNNTDRRGGRFSSAAISDGTWHCFIISNGTLTKSGFSKNLNPTADDLYPAGYVHYRRVASWGRVAGVLVGMIQDEDDFTYKTPSNDINASNPGTAAVLRAINVPTGIKVRAKIKALLNDNVTGTIFGYFSDPAGVDLVPSGNNAQVTYLTSIAMGFFTFENTFEVVTNASAQIRTRVQFSDTNLTMGGITYGYTDKRGRS